MTPFTKYFKKKSPAGLFNVLFYRIFQYFCFPINELYDIGTAKLVSAITQRISKLWRRTTHQSKALDDIYNLAVSKHDLKHFSKSDLPGFAGCVFMDLNCCLIILKCFVNDLEMCFS